MTTATTATAAEATGRERVVGGMRSGIPFALATFAFGASFGVLARAADLGPLEATVMSAFVWAGSSQFALASVLDAGGTLAAAAVAAVLLNARFAAMAVAVAPSMRGGRLGRAAQAMTVSDESWALAHQGGGRYDPLRMVGVAIAMWPGWVGGTAVGALAGDALGDPAALGLDAAFPALFLALLVPQLRGRRDRAAALLAVAIAVVTVPFLPPGLPIVLAAAAALIGLVRR